MIQREINSTGLFDLNVQDQWWLLDLTSGGLGVWQSIRVTLHLMHGAWATAIVKLQESIDGVHWSDAGQFDIGGGQVGVDVQMPKMRVYVSTLEGGTSLCSLAAVLRSE